METKNKINIIKELNMMREAITKVEKGNSESSALLVAYLEIERIKKLMGKKYERN